jgi:ribosomal protein L23
MRNRRTGVYSRKASSKRAMVTLADGDSIELFEV